MLVNTNGLALIGPGSEWFWSMLQFVDRGGDPGGHLLPAPQLPERERVLAARRAGR